MIQSTRIPTLSKDDIALAMFHEANIDPLDAAVFMRNATRVYKEKNLKDFSSMNKLLHLGQEAHQDISKSISLEKAVALTLKVKQHRRPRTRQDIATMTNRLFRFFPELKRKKVRAIKTQDCLKYLETTFTTPSQFAKARRILSGIFSVAVKHGYAATNPVTPIAIPIIKEKEIHALTIEEMKRLYAVACQKKHLPCQVAAAIMLYAGIRPKEVERLTWADICLKDRVIYIRAEHSKTGGTRHVTIHPPLYRILQAMMPQDRSKKICPHNWSVRWRKLRKEAGWNPQTNPWQQDCLRHTFATYYIKHFRNFNALQYEMGHRSSDLLRTRYINLGTITQTNAQNFWKPFIPISRAHTKHF